MAEESKDKSKNKKGLLSALKKENEKESSKTRKYQLTKRLSLLLGDDVGVDKNVAVNSKKVHQGIINVGKGKKTLSLRYNSLGDK